MPVYAPQIGQAGAALGGAGGGAAGGLLGALGSVLEPLDYPRQALWNTVRGPLRYLSGEGTTDDLLSAIPGGLGAGLTAGLAASGVGLPLAVLLGSGLGLAGQAIGKGTGREAFNAANVEDLTGTQDVMPNMLVGALTDPLTYAGGLGGAARGAEAGQRFGKGLELAAAFKGPNYANESGEFIKNMVRQVADQSALGNKVNLENVYGHLNSMLGNPGVFSEIHPQSQFLGAGESTIAFRHPETGGVTTVRMPSMVEGDVLPGTVNPTIPPPTRLDIPEQLQAVRSKAFPIPGPEAADPMRVEHAPFLASATSGDTFGVKAMESQMKKQGLNPWDLHMANVGVTPEGGMMVRDANAIAGTRGYMGPFNQWQGLEDVPRAAEQAMQEPSRLQNAILNLLGSGKSVQGDIAAGIAQGPRGGSTVLPNMTVSVSSPARATSPAELLSTTQTIPRPAPSIAERRLSRLLGRV